MNKDKESAIGPDEELEIEESEELLEDKSSDCLAELFYFSDWRTRNWECYSFSIQNHIWIYIIDIIVNDLTRNIDDNISEFIEYYLSYDD